MLGNVYKLVKATTSLINTTSGRLFGESAGYAVSAANDLASASESQAQALLNVATGAAKIAATGVAAGVGAMALGSALGMGVTANAALGVANYAFNSSLISATQAMITKATVFVASNATAATVGSGVFHTLLNGKMLMEGISEVCSAAKSEFDAVSYLTYFAANTVKSAGYSLAGTAIKSLETLDRLIGSDQDGQGKDINMFTLSVDLTDADVAQKEEKLFEDKVALDNAIAVNQKAISELTSNNEITKSAKSGHQVVSAALEAQKANLAERENSIEITKDMLAGWNILEKSEEYSTQDIISKILDSNESNFEDSVTINGDAWDMIDLTSSIAA
jgi:hypothetical protein